MKRTFSESAFWDVGIFCNVLRFADWKVGDGQRHGRRHWLFTWFVKLISASGF